MRLRRKSRASNAPKPRPEETWVDSIFWGASMTVLVVLALVAGVGYLGYSNLERPRQDLAILKVVRVAGVLTVASIASLVFFLAKRERRVALPAAADVNNQSPQ